MGPDGGAVMGIVRLLLPSPCASRDRPPWVCCARSMWTTRFHFDPRQTRATISEPGNWCDNAVCMIMSKGVFVELFARTDLFYPSAQTSLYQNREATRDAFLQLHAEWTELSNAINPRALQQ